MLLSRLLSVAPFDCCLLSLNRALPLLRLTSVPATRAHLRLHMWLRLPLRLHSFILPRDLSEAEESCS